MLGGFVFYQTQKSSDYETCPEAVVYGSAGSGGGGTVGGPAELVNSLLQERKVKTDLVANPYEASQEDFADYERSVKQGQGKLLSWVEDFQDQCKNAKVLLVGFSQGAHVTHEAIAELDSTENIKALLVADPIRNGEDPAIEDFLMGSGPTGRLGDYLARNGYEPKPLNSKLSGLALSICHRGDIVCNSGGTPISNMHGAGFRDPAAVARIEQWLDQALTLKLSG